MLRPETSVPQAFGRDVPDPAANAIMLRYHDRVTLQPGSPIPLRHRHPWLTALLVLATLYFAAGFATSRVAWLPTSAPPSGAPALVPDGSTAVQGVTHVHTERSHDSRGTPAHVARTAKQTGLDFVLLGDHPSDKRPPPAREVQLIDGILVAFGYEIVLPEIGRVVAVDLANPGQQRDWTPTELHERFRADSVTAIVVHGRSPRRRERWKTGQTLGMHGWEVLDISEAARRELKGPWSLYHLFSFLINLPLGRGHESLLRTERLGFGAPAVAVFDSLSRNAPLTALAGLNHHPKWMPGGVPFPPYTPFFRTYVNHLVLAGPLPRDPDAALDSVSGVIRRGHAFVSLGDARRAQGFRLAATAPGVQPVPMGGRVRLRPGAVLRTSDMGASGRLVFRVIRNGQPIGAFRGRSLAIPLRDPGVYRVEVFRYTARLGSLFFDLRPWIFSNPVRVTAG